MCQYIFCTICSFHGTIQEAIFIVSLPVSMNEGIKCHAITPAVGKVIHITVGIPAMPNNSVTTITFHTTFFNGHF